jgi:hydroxymethylpyrimidine pyrophosphatase-like HAD family hydrolase
MRIAVDFDGTIVDHEYPAIGKEKLFALRTLIGMQKRGCTLILWTYRAGKELDEAVEYCRKNGLEFYAINKNYPEEVFDESISRKIDADMYIDDRNFGGFPGWDVIWHTLYPEDKNSYQIPQHMLQKRSLLQRIRNAFYNPK